MALSLSASNMSKSSNSVVIYRSQSRDIVLTLNDGGGVKPLDLTQATLTFTVKRSPNDTEVLISKSSTSSAQIQITPPSSAGIATIYIVPADTKLLPAQTYYFDVWVSYPGGTQYPVVPVAQFVVRDVITKF